MATPRESRLATPEQVYLAVMRATGDKITAIRAIRACFELDLREAKEVTIRAEGSTVEEHNDRIAEAVEQALALRRAAVDSRDSSTQC